MNTMVQQIREILDGEYESARALLWHLKTLPVKFTPYELYWLQLLQHHIDAEISTKFAKLKPARLA